jgi:hypothetical protein
VIFDPGPRYRDDWRAVALNERRAIAKGRRDDLGLSRDGDPSRALVFFVMEKLLARCRL